MIQTKQIDPYKLDGDARWGDGYDMFPCLLIEAEEHLWNLLPLREDLHPDILIGIASTQAAANQLPMRLCTGTVGFNFLSQPPNREWAEELHIWPVHDRILPTTLRLPYDMLVSKKQIREIERFITERGLARPYLDRCTRRLTNRWANNYEHESTGYDDDGVPKGCTRCPRCGEYQGFYAEAHRPACGNQNGHSTACYVYCLCANNNRCAACGKLLAERKLRGHYFDDRGDRISYYSGLHALAHRCAEADLSPPMDFVAERMEAFFEYEADKHRMGWK